MGRKVSALCEDIAAHLRAAGMHSEAQEIISLRTLNPRHTGALAATIGRLITEGKK